MTPSDQADKPSPGPIWKEPWVWAALAVALALRAGALVWIDPEPDGLARWYVRGATAMASGHGLLMRTPGAWQNPNEFSTQIRETEYMKQRARAGGRIDPEHPYPRRTDGWVPATLRPAGYSTLLYLLYQAGNYDGMVLGAHLLQAGLDAFVCVLLFLLGRNVYNRRAGLAAAWIYALMPPAIVLTFRMLPDSLGRFFPALILCLASYARPGRGWVLVPAGMACGLAFYFRPGFLLFPAVLFLIAWVWRRRLLWSLGWAGAAVAGLLLVQLPWLLWTRAATGTALFTTTSAGGSMYEALGEDPNNPWGVVLHDNWVDRDAIRRGFVSAWSVEADRFYRAEWRKCVGERPDFYARLVLFRRLPLAVLPPYIVRGKAKAGDFSFSKVRIEEGLGHSEAIRKYPLRVMKAFWREMIMLGISAVLLTALVGVAAARWRDWRRSAWFVLPWGYAIGTICLIKQVEPRNVSPALVPQSLALALAILGIQAWWKRRRERRPASVAGRLDADQTAKSMS